MGNESIKIVEVKEHEPVDYFLSTLTNEEIEQFKHEAIPGIKEFLQRFEVFQRNKSNEMKQCLSCGHKQRKKTEKKVDPPAKKKK